MTAETLLGWADGHHSGPNKTPPSHRGWLENQIINGQRTIARMVCSECHERVGRIVESNPDAGPVLYLLHAPPRRDRRGGIPERVLFGSMRLRQAFETLAGPALLVRPEQVGDDFIFHGYLDSNGVNVVQNRTTLATWVDTGDRDGSWWCYLPGHATPTRVPKEEGPRRRLLEIGAGQPDNTTIGWRFVDPPPRELQFLDGLPVLGPRGRLGDSDECVAVCNARSGRHLVVFVGSDIHAAVTRYRRTGRRGNVPGRIEAPAGTALD